MSDAPNQPVEGKVTFSPPAAVTFLFWHEGDRCPRCGGWASGPSASRCLGGMRLGDLLTVYCSQDETGFATRSGRTWAFPLDEPRDLPRASAGDQRGQRRFVNYDDYYLDRVHNYHDAEGNLLFRVFRKRHREIPGRKLIFQQRADGAWTMDGVESVLYRLPRVLRAVREAKPIWLVEGETDAEAGERHAGEECFTSAPGGADKWHPSYTEALRGAVLVNVVADADERGLKHARDVGSQLRSAGIRTRIWLPAAGKDLRDHLEAGLTLAQLKELGDE